MVEELLRGLYEYWSNQTSLPLFGRLYLGRAPEGTQDTYFTVEVVSVRPETSMGIDAGNSASGTRWENVLLQVTLHTESEAPQVAMLTAQSVMLWLDHQSFAVDGGSIVSMTRQNYVPLADPDGGYQINMDYLVDIEEA